jgi:diguanylate cyclase (GGDEF)-like protein/PAS domain S-box-containing protein
VRPYDFDARRVMLGSRIHVLGIVRDITMRKRAEQQIVRAKERLDLALTSSSLALWDWDFALRRVYFNESWARMLGDEARESTYNEEHLLALAHPEDRDVLEAAVGNAAKGVSEAFDVEYRVPSPHGGWIWVHARGKVTQREGAKALRMTGTCTDITKRKQAEERAEFLATRDALTGLPNRVLLHDRLEQGVANAARHGTGFAFMFIDLDRFKTINDSLGHHIGDELLKNVAARLTACVRATDTVARLGGDEFAVILENLRDDDDEGAQEVAEKMIAAMGAPLIVEGQPLNTSCSIGISLYPADGRDSATLMKNADVAMYFAKEQGRNNYQFFSGDMNARAQERLSVENYLRLALKRNELIVYYQPRMRVDTGELVGVEALIRWQHPRRGLLTPDRFIDVAEDSGLIVPMGEWVLATACAQLQAWQSTVRNGLRMSVNVSVGQVGNGDRLYRAVADAVSNAGLDPRLLELELTESHLMQDAADKLALLDKLGALGVGLSIDDFGTGYSSLSYLKRLPVDSIKIDGSFVRDIVTDPNDEAIIQAILAMAHSLDLLVVAEGVETPAQLEALRALHCDEYQGFLESPGLPAAEFQKRYGKFGV